MIVITVARKPLSEANVAANVLKHGCGANNVNACRIATADDLNGGAYSAGGPERHDGAENWRYKRGEQGGLAGVGFTQPLGRWPANLILGHRDGCQESASVWVCTEDCPIVCLDAQSDGGVSRYFKQVGGKR